MPANLETMMYTGEVPWHRQGTKLDNPATAEQAITAAGLNWDVQIQPLYTGVDRNIRIKDRHAICRVDRLDQPDGGQLAVVGGDYTPLQNREAFQFLDPVVGEGGAVYHTAGSLRAGRQVWMLAKLPGEIRVAGEDVTEKYILLSNSHDGSSAVRIGLTPIRVVCQNTLNLALQGMAGEGLTIRHYPDVATRVREAHRLLGIVNEQFERAGQIMVHMARVQMTGEMLPQYIESVMPLPTDDEVARQKTIQRHNRLKDLFETGDGNRLPGVASSLWAAYNAVTQWVDRESYTARLKEPIKSIWFGDGARLKQTAFDAAARMATPSLN